MNAPKLRFREFNDEWKEIKLSDISSKITKGTTPKKYDTSGVNFIKVENIHNNSITNINSYISKNIHEKDLKRSILKENDVLFSIAGALGRTAIIKNDILPANTNQACAIIRPDKSNFINLNYLINRLNNIDIQNYIFKCQSVGAQPNLSLEQVNNICITVPTVKEQEKIGTLLSLLDKKIELQSKKIEALKLYKMCISKKLFDNKNLTTTLLKNICNIKKGQQLNNEYLKVNGTYYMLNGGMLPSGYTDNYNTLENTISISEGGNSCGYVNFNKEKFWSGGHCYTVEPININNEYLFQLLKYYEKAIMSLRVGSGLPNIQKKDLEIFKVAIHTQNEQKDISKALGKIDLKIVLESKKLSNLESLKKGLMQNMFV